MKGAIGVAQTSVRVRTVQDACVAVGWSGHRTLTIDRPEQAGGMGLGFNGGELLLLAIGGSRKANSSSFAIIYIFFSVPHMLYC